MISNLNNLPAPQFKELLRDAQDLDKLKEFALDQSATRLCIDSKGHLWTQKIDVNFLLQFCQLISRALFEKNFDCEEDKVNFLVDHVQDLLIQSLVIATATATRYSRPAIELEGLKKRFDKNTFKTELEALKRAQEQISQIFSNSTLSPEKRREQLESVQQLSILVECFTYAREYLLLTATAIPLIQQSVVSSEPVKVEEVMTASVTVEPQPSPIVSIAKNLLVESLTVQPELPEANPEANQELPVHPELPAANPELPVDYSEQPTITPKRPLTNYFKDLKKMTTQLLASSEPAEMMLRKKLDTLAFNPTFENREKLKGILAGTIDYYLLAESEDQKERALDFGNIVSSKILSIEYGFELISEINSHQYQPFIQSLTLGVFALLIKKPQEVQVANQVSQAVDSLDAPFFDVAL